MDAVKFLKELKRMYCADCENEEDGSYNFKTILSKDPYEFVGIVDHWAREHPVKTNKDVFFDFLKQHFPDCGHMEKSIYGDWIKLYLNDVFWEEEYNGEPLEHESVQEEQKQELSFVEFRVLFKEMCNDMGVLKSCVFFNKTNIGCNGCMKWCFDHPDEAQKIVLNWKKEKEEKGSDE